MTYNPFREPGAPPVEPVVIDPKDAQIAEMQQRADAREYSHKLLEEAISRNEKKIAVYRERLMRAFAGHIHAKYDGCEPDCPKYGAE